MKAIIAAVVVLSMIAAPAFAQAPGPLAPDATTAAATGVGRTTATVNGTVDPNASATTYHVEYGTSTAYGLRSPDRSAGDGSTPLDVSVALSGLSSDTSYHFRVVATNAAGTARGADLTLRTTRPAQPLALVTTGAFAELGARGVTVTGSVNPRGGATTYRFEYGVGTSLDRRTAAEPAGAGGAAIAIAARLTLTPSTRYSYRIVATNAAGTSRGSTRSFTTPAEVQAIAIELSSNPIAYGDGVTITGRLQGAGTRNVPIALELQQFPFGGPFNQVGAVERVAADGSVRFTVPTLIVSSRVRLVTRTAIVSTSLAPTVRTAVRAGLRLERLRDRRVRFSGLVRPAVAGAAVSLQRRRGGRFVPVRRTVVRVGAGGRAGYRVTVNARRQGAIYRVVVVPPPASGHVRGASRQLLVGGARRR